MCSSGIQYVMNTFSQLLCKLFVWLLEICFVSCKPAHIVLCFDSNQRLNLLTILIGC
jgi:hypothetical protein